MAPVAVLRHTDQVAQLFVAFHEKYSNINLVHEKDNLGLLCDKVRDLKKGEMAKIASEMIKLKHLAQNTYFQHHQSRKYFQRARNLAV